MNIKVINAEALETLIKEVLTETEYTWGDGGLEVTLGRCDDGIKISSDGKNITLAYSALASLFRGIGVIVSKGASAYEIEQKMQFKQLGNMVDCSRNGVMKVEKVKQFIRISALFGFNMLQLYTEDTYEIEGEPYFGHLRGRYTRAELKEIDDYAFSLGIEVIPCIQTLAHLDAMFNWREYSEIKDIDNILNVGMARTYELIEKMFITAKECFRSNQINIGMDEAHHLGVGAYLDKFGYKKRSEIMKEHLEKVIALCRKYEYKPMMWSDMFFRMCSETGDYYDPNAVITEEVISSVPEEMNLVFWNYYINYPEFYRGEFEKHMMFKRKVSFAGGSATWYGFAPMQKYSIENARAAFEAIGDYSIDTVFNTMWGDDGAETSSFAALPTLALYGEGAWTGDTSDEAIRAAMKIIGASFDDFLEMNILYKTPSISADWAVMSKYMLYGDALQGMWDSNIPKGIGNDFAKAVPVLEKCAKSNPKWSYIFEPLAALVNVLAQKAELGIEIKAAYDRDDKAELSRIANNIIPSLVKDINKFLKLHRKRWRCDNKDFGFEVQDIRLGGLMTRLNSISELLNEYVNCECGKLDELEAQRLSIDKNIQPGTPVSKSTYKQIITVARF